MLLRALETEATTGDDPDERFEEVRLSGDAAEERLLGGDNQEQFMDVEEAENSPDDQDGEQPTSPSPQKQSDLVGSESDVQSEQVQDSPRPGSSNTSPVSTSSIIESTKKRKSTALDSLVTLTTGPSPKKAVSLSG
jgi:hypothetical protein